MSISFIMALSSAVLLSFTSLAIAQEYQPEGFAIAPAGAFDIANAPAPLYRDPIFDGAADPTIVYSEKDRTWTMFYTQRRANVPQAGVGWCYGSQIGIAKSTDDGRNWEYSGVCLGLGRGKQAETFWAPHVFLHDGVWHMVVTYIPRIGGNGNWGGKGQLAHYTSVDGEHWKDEGLIDCGSDNVIDPAVIKLKDGKWLLVFRDDNAGVKTAKCVSEDLKTWTRLKDTIGDQTHEGPVIFYWKDSFWMICDDWKGLGVYKSDDGQTFERVGRILSDPGKRREDNIRGGHAGVAVVGDQAYVFYFTHPGRAGDADKVKESSPGTMLYESNRTSIQVAELGIEDGKMVAYRDKYAK
jgi:hypothetical protein